MQTEVSELSRGRLPHIALGALLLILGQYIISDWVYNYGANDQLVSYVGFAGTIVSIILALLAIIYSYYQNFSQQRDSGNIASQIQLLRAVVEDVRDSEVDLKRSLSQLDELGAKLDQTLEVGRLTSSEFARVHDRMEEVQNVLADLRAKRKESQAIDATEEELVRPAGRTKVGKTASPLQLSIYLSLHATAGRGVPMDGGFDVILRPVLKERNLGEHYTRFVHGYYVATTYLLADLGLIETGPEFVIESVDDVLIAAAIEKANRIPDTVDSDFRAMIEAALTFDGQTAVDAGSGPSSDGV